MIQPYRISKQTIQKNPVTQAANDIIFRSFSPHFSAVQFHSPIPSPIQIQDNRFHSPPASYKNLFFFVKSVHHRHDRTAMNDKRRIFHMSGNQKSDLFFHSFHTALSEFFLILSSRKRRYPSAFQPLYISGVLFQLLICFPSNCPKSHSLIKGSKTIGHPDKSVPQIRFAVCTQRFMGLAIIYSGMG